MDMTVSAPLDMGTGQQRYVVAYTLKQDTEKKPDILNAQKSKISAAQICLLFFTCFFLYYYYIRYRCRPDVQRK